MHKDLKNLWLPYTQMKGLNSILKAQKTDSSKIFLDNGKSLIDGISSWWTACHGYNNKHIRKNIISQLNLMPHVMFGGLVHDQAVLLSKRLSKLLNNKLEKVFFTDSGSVSVEVALKIAIQYWINKGNDKKNKFIFFKNGYHGDTSGTMAICDPEEGMHKLFKNYLRKNYMLNIPETDKDKNKFVNFVHKYNDKVAGVIIEPLVQGAGGMKFYSPSTLEFIYKVIKKYKLLLIYDEIATGFFRTGSMFAYQQTNSSPDILCIGKALTGGTLSLAATISTKKVFAAFLSNKKNRELMHGPTYMANPLACSAANASLDLFEKVNYKKKIKIIEKVFQKDLEKFRRFKFVKQVRAKGAIGVIEFFNLSKNNIMWLREEFVKKNIWVRPLKNIIYFMPPFIINKNELNHLIESTYKILSKWKKNNEK